MLPAANDPSRSGGERAVLRRSMSQLELFVLAFGSVIGVGWVTAVGSRKPVPWALSAWAEPSCRASACATPS
jgi:hypothetical protein